MASSSLVAIDSLSLAQQVAQMVVVRASGHLFDVQIEYPAWEPPQATLREWIGAWGVGGVILLGGTAAEVWMRSRQLQSWSEIPLFVAADVEEGVGQRFAGATWFPPPMAIAEIARRDLSAARRYAWEMGEITARQAQALGINWILAPVVDVNNNPQNPVINVRAFGDTPEVVGELTQAFIRGSQQHSVLNAAKHFPGHGDTSVDSHLHLPTIPHSQQRWQQVERVPFARAIAAGVDAVMSAHLRMPAFDDRLPATLSPAILTGQLRQQMGFSGLIVTDALVMGAIANAYTPATAAVMAVEAGADILLMPSDPKATIEAVVEAVEAGRISRERIRASVARIWQAKSKIASSCWQHGGDPIPDLPATFHPSAQSLLVASSSQWGNGQLPPAGEQQTPCNVIVVDELLREEALKGHPPAIAVPWEKGYQLRLCDRFTPSVAYWELKGPVLVQLFARGHPFRGVAGMAPEVDVWLRQLLDRRQLQALVIYGSPYLRDRWFEILPEETVGLFSFGQMQAAQACLMEKIFA
ncbi:glycoside hydrolase family 3 N-terminal domain-containing protein [Geitlerinema sp. PCC 9228]|jgi:beta-glucosidase|uniref:glycoside hydrolase family 3 N-terminal domain-containing protein n=1 Tax=Geitlerinema sp. PCC 9228 TaxID=111611 RepID=UPI0008F9B660|nr:glycoside hydrolase family 3 N-terminal domain-containing protein [Geitlerinema sp. PCC 9228]